MKYLIVYTSDFRTYHTALYDSWGKAHNFICALKPYVAWYYIHAIQTKMPEPVAYEKNDLTGRQKVVY